MKNFEQVREETLTEGYSRRFTDKDVDKEFKSFGNEKRQKEFFGDLDKARAEMKLNDYHPGNSARPKVWTALRYPVRDGDYYFAFIDKNERKNMKYNEQLNDALKKAKVGGDKKSVDDMWLIASNELRTYPKSLGWNDTMTREEIYGAIQHLLGKIRESNIIEKQIKTKAGIMVGKRMKAPRYESASVEESINELNGQTGKLINLRYRPQKINIRKGLTSFSTIEKSDLYRDITKNKANWSITANTNSLEIRLPHPKGHEADRESWMGLVKDAIPGKAGNLIRGGGLTRTEVQELKRDFEKAAKAFGADKVVSQDHSIYVSHKTPGKLKVVKGLTAMLKALDEFGMRNHVSLSGRDGVLTQIQDAGQYNESVKGDNMKTIKEQVSFAFDTMKAAQTFERKVDGKPLNIVKVGIGKYYVVELRPDTDAKDRQKAAKIAVQMGLKEDSSEAVKEFKDPTKNFPRDREWKKLVRKHKRHIKALQDKGKDLPSDAEEDFVSWGMQNGEISNSDDIERFIDDELLNASYVPEGGMNLKELRRKNSIISEKYRSKFKADDVAKAVKIAHSMGGNMTGAYKKIEKMKKGLGDDPMVAAALRVANEEVN